jgi:hypothetical protein
MGPPLARAPSHAYGMRGRPSQKDRTLDAPLLQVARIEHAEIVAVSERQRGNEKTPGSGLLDVHNISVKHGPASRSSSTYTIRVTSTQKKVLIAQWQSGRLQSRWIYRQVGRSIRSRDFPFAVCAPWWCVTLPFFPCTSQIPPSANARSSFGAVEVRAVRRMRPRHGCPAKPKWRVMLGGVPLLPRQILSLTSSAHRQVMLCRQVWVFISTSRSHTAHIPHQGKAIDGVAQLRIGAAEIGSVRQT